MKTAYEAESTIEKLSMKLQHANPVVVIGVIRSILGMLGWIAPES